jgi:hypothetical protein
MKILLLAGSSLVFLFGTFGCKTTNPEADLSSAQPAAVTSSSGLGGGMPSTFQFACTIEGIKYSTANYVFTRQGPAYDFAAKYSLVVNWQDKNRGPRSYSCSNVDVVRMAGTVIMTLDGCSVGGVQIVKATEGGGVFTGSVRNAGKDYPVNGRF